MSRRYQILTGFVLAGGGSRRMGRPKELLAILGVAMLERQAGLLRSVASSVFRVGEGGAREDRGINTLPDILRGRGPLAGIYTGLCRTKTEYNFFIACDLAFAGPRLAGFLTQIALEIGADVTVPRSHDGRIQPLCGVYRRRLRGIIRARLEAGLNKADGFFPDVRCRIVPWSELARAGFPRRIFDNMNTQADFARILRRFEMGNS